MSHDNLPEIPKDPCDDSGTCDCGEDHTLVSPPDLSCLTEEERQLCAAAVSEIMAARLMDNEAMFAMGMSKLMENGSHIVGHTLQMMVWTSIQILVVRSGRKPGSIAGAVVAMGNDGREAIGDLAADFVADFYSAIGRGDQDELMKVWADFLEATANDFESFKWGVLGAITVAVTNLNSELVEGEAVPGLGQSLSVIPNRDN